METEKNIIESEAVVEETPKTNPIEAQYNEGLKNEEIKSLAAKVNEQSAQIEELNQQLSDAKTRLALLLAGIAQEKLDESAALAAGICRAGKSPEEAAREIADAYPHLKAVKNEMPKFAASGSGADDGFSAVRRIFAKR
ncbi:MAG: hypothetical protein J1F28_03625 [Oscillospiraceae bacterium]|nr:hypothetical protein [Oscillospiraceae bacterium]